MAILNIQAGVTGLSNTIPSFIYIQTNDTFATVTSTGYLNNARQEGFAFSPNNLVVIDTTDVGPILLQIKIVGGNINLVEYVPGVQLPTKVNHIATYLNVYGRLGEDATTAINEGNIQAGNNGVAGGFVSYPSIANKGRLLVEAAANLSNYDCIITNDLIGQTTIYYLPDTTTNDCTFITSDAGTGNTQHIRTGNLQLDSGGVYLTNGNVTVTVGNVTTYNGNITAGSTGHSGSLTCYASTGNNTLSISSTVNNNPSNIDITNDPFYASSTIKIPSPESDSVAKFLIAENDTPFVAGNIPVAKNTLGVMYDAGISSASLSNLVTNGNGAGNISLFRGNVTHVGGAVSFTYDTVGVTHTQFMVLAALETTNNAYITDYYPGTATSPGNYVNDKTLVVWNVDPGTHMVAWISVS